MTVPADAQLIAGIALGLLIALAGLEWFDPLPRERRPMPIPDQVNVALAEMFAAHEVATARAAEAHAREAAAIQARKDAEDSKAVGKLAADAMHGKRMALVAMLNDVQAPALPPPAP